MCPRCEGRGSVTDFDLTALYDDSKSLNEGALTIPGYSMDGWYGRIFSGCGFFDPDKPIREVHQDASSHDLLYKEPTKIKVEGINLTYEGLIPKIQKSMLSKDVDAMQPHIRAFVERAVDVHHLPRLRRHPAQRGGPVVEDRRRSTSPTPARCRSATWPSGCAASTSRRWRRCSTALRETLDSFVEIGLGYLSLDRPSGTLSGGEAQRTKMIRHLGSSLTDVTYVFDEPTIGLHPHDIQRMNDLLLQLRDKGNTVLVVEHKPEAIAIADHVVDLGPGAGTAGGEVVFEGTVEGLRASGTLTGRHLDDRASLKPSVRDAVGRAGGARRQHPQPAGRRRRHPARRAGGGDRRGRVGQELADPRLGVGPGRRGVGRPGRDPRLAAQQPGDLHRAARPDPQGVREGQRREAGAVQRQLRGRLPQLQRRRRHLHRPGDDGRRRHHLRGVRGQAVPGGGAGVHARRPATSARCSRCRWPRPRSSSAPARRSTPAAHKILDRLADVGLGYLSLGQPLPTLSGGERQRLKLATHMAEKGGVYVLDEPTTGLHLADVEQLLGLLDRLVDSGKSVIVIEHHQAVMAHADWIIDLGPGAGHDGGRIVFEGTPADLVAARSTLTGEHLAAYVGA